jgi:hypothetical protein
MAAGVVLGFVQAFAFLFGHHAIGFGFVLGAINRRLLVFHAFGFPRGQSTRSHALVYAFFLIGLALVDARGGGGVGRGLSQSAQTSQSQAGADQGVFELEHVQSP